jgi:hypothetical protein
METPVDRQGTKKVELQTSTGVKTYPGKNFSLAFLLKNRKTHTSSKADLISCPRSQAVTLNMFL